MKLNSLFVIGVMAVAMSAPAQAQVIGTPETDNDRPHPKAVARRSQRRYGQGRHGH